MNNAFVIFSIFLALAVQECFSIVKEKPSFIKTCYISEPDFPSCNRESIQNVFSGLKDGYPEIGLIPIDPLKVTEIKLLQGSGPVSINAILRNVVVTGFSKVVVLSNKVYPEKGYSFVSHLRVPNLKIEGDYAVKGKILLLPLFGNGTCLFEPKNMTVEVSHDINIVRKEGFNFFNINGVHVKFEIEGLKLRLNNLFNGAKQLEEQTNAYLNENWKAAGESLKPILRQTIADILIVILKKLFDNVPANFFIGDVVYKET